MLSLRSLDDLDEMCDICREVRGRGETDWIPVSVDAAPGFLYSRAMKYLRKHAPDIEIKVTYRTLYLRVKLG